jgi:NAD-dependent SIR2 family protein deacetylase
MDNNKYKKIIACTDCKKKTDDWDWVHEGMGIVVAVCLKCTKKEMSSSSFERWIKERDKNETL